MNKRRKAEFYIRVSAHKKLFSAGFFFQKKSGWMETFHASDGTPIQIGFNMDKGCSSRWWIGTELTTGLACAGAKTYDEAKQFVSERIDVIAKGLRAPEKVRFAQELAEYSEVYPIGE